MNNKRLLAELFHVTLSVCSVNWNMQGPWKEERWKTGFAGRYICLLVTISPLTYSVFFGAHAVEETEIPEDQTFFPIPYPQSM